MRRRSGGAGRVRSRDGAGATGRRRAPRAAAPPPPGPARHPGWQGVRGPVPLNGRRLAAGDGAAVSDEPRIELAGDPAGEVLLFDLA